MTRLPLAQARDGRVFVLGIKGWTSPERAFQLAQDVLAAIDAAYAQQDHAAGRVPDPPTDEEIQAAKRRQWRKNQTARRRGHAKARKAVKT